MCKVNAAWRATVIFVNHTEYMYSIKIDIWYLKINCVLRNAVPQVASKINWLHQYNETITQMQNR